MRILDISSRGAILQRTIFKLTKDSGCRFTPALRPHTRPEMVRCLVNLKKANKKRASITAEFFDIGDAVSRRFK